MHPNRNCPSLVLSPFGNSQTCRLGLIPVIVKLEQTPGRKWRGHVISVFGHLIGEILQDLRLSRGHSTTSMTKAQNTAIYRTFGASVNSKFQVSPARKSQVLDADRGFCYLNKFKLCCGDSPLSWDFDSRRNQVTALFFSHYSY